MKTILAPVDFSKISDAVVNEAAALARALDGRVILLTVIQPPVVVTEYAAMIEVVRSSTVIPVSSWKPGPQGSAGSEVADIVSSVGMVR
jgi:nucleotide-binding universal stress UspA family protein